MHVSEGGYRDCNGGVLEVLLVHVGGALDQPGCILLSDGHEGVSGELICVSLRWAEQRHAQKIKYRMPHLVRRRVKELPHNCINGCYSVRRRFLRRGLLHFAHIFITESDRWALVPRVGDPALLRPHGQLNWQSQRAENLPNPLQGSASQHHPVDGLELLAARLLIFDADPVWLQVGLLVAKKRRPGLLRCLGLAVKARKQSNPNGDGDTEERRNSNFSHVRLLSAANSSQTRRPALTPVKSPCLLSFRIIARAGRGRRRLALTHSHPAPQPRVSIS